jgi:hypothetical protein
VEVEKGPGTSPGPFDSNADSNRSGEGILHGPCRLGRHAWHHLTVDVEGNGDGGVPEHLLDYLGVCALQQEKACRRVTEIVEPIGAGRSALSRSGLKDRRTRLLRLSGVPVTDRNTRPFSSHRLPSLAFSSSWAARWSLRASIAWAVSSMFRRLLAVLGSVKRGPP